jgi:hypothetical protein
MLRSCFHTKYMHSSHTYIVHCPMLCRYFGCLHQPLSQVHTGEYCSGTSFTYLSQYYSYNPAPSFTCSAQYPNSRIPSFWRASCGPVPGYSGQVLSIDYYEDSACTEAAGLSTKILQVQDACQNSDGDSYENVRCDALQQTVSYTRYIPRGVTTQTSATPHCTEGDSHLKVEYKFPQPPKVYEINFNCEKYDYPNSRYYVTGVYSKYTCEEGVPVTVAAPAEAASKTKPGPVFSASSLRKGHVQVREKYAFHEYLLP